MPPILPRPSPKVQAVPTSIEADALARIDTCPACCINSEAPYRVEIEADGFIAFYACLDCGHFWFTGWGL